MVCGREVMVNPCWSVIGQRSVFVSCPMVGPFEYFMFVVFGPALYDVKVVDVYCVCSCGNGDNKCFGHALLKPRRRRLLFC